MGHRPGILVRLPEPARAGPHQASGFRLYSMLIDAATHGLGAAIGRPVPITTELENGTLVPVLDDQADTPNAAASSPSQPPDKDPKSKHHHTPRRNRHGSPTMLLGCRYFAPTTRPNHPPDPEAEQALPPVGCHSGANTMRSRWGVTGSRTYAATPRGTGCTAAPVWWGGQLERSPDEG